MAQPSFDQEISAITDPVRLQQLQIVWLREVHRKAASINAWVTFFGLVSVAGLVLALLTTLARAM